jgi:energy-coupling factor transporter ATP-binding protein EcfA2
VRLIVAAVPALKPEALIFDEPTTAQDYRGAQAILDLSKARFMPKEDVIRDHPSALNDALLTPNG